MLFRVWAGTWAIALCMILPYQGIVMVLRFLDWLHGAMFRSGEAVAGACAAVYNRSPNFFGLVLGAGAGAACTRLYRGVFARAPGLARIMGVDGGFNERLARMASGSEASGSEAPSSSPPSSRPPSPAQGGSDDGGDELAA